MKWRWLLLLLPLALGLLLSAWLYNLGSSNPLFRIRISLSTSLLLGGFLTTLLLAAGWVLWRLAGQRHEREMDDLQMKANRDRRRFLQRLDHELKNPLMAMRAGLANFANAPTPEARNAALSTVESQTVRLSRLTADLRKIAELESRPLERSPVNLELLLREVVELAQEKPEANKRSIRLTLPQAPWPLPTISADWDLIFLAIYNLLDNALKFSRPGDTVEVRGREDGRHVDIEVADTGPGIGPDDLPHVWEELYRGQGGRTVSGSGLGMALVKAIVERHGGAVFVSSKVDRGTVVTVQLPVGETGIR